MRVGKDFWFILKLIVAVVRALKEVFDKPDEPIENGG